MDAKEGIVPGTALGISFQIGLGDGKQLVFQVHVDAESEPKALNDVLDKIRLAGERQAAFSDLEQLEKVLEQHYDGLKNLETQYAEVESNAKLRHQAEGKRGEFRLSAKEQVDKKNAEQSRGKFHEMIDKLQAQIAIAKGKIGE